MKLLDIDLESDASLVAVRRAARRVAEAVGLSTQDQTRLAAAASEVSRRARDDGVGPLRLVVEDSALRVEILGYLGPVPEAGRMVDWAEIREGVLRLEKRLPDGGPSAEGLEALRLELLTADPRAAAEEIRRQNAELVTALAEQRAAEEARRRIEARLRQAIEVTRLGTWELEGERWKLSSRAQEIFGVEADQDPLVQADPKTKQLFAEAVDGLLQRGETLELELPLRPGVWVIVRGMLQGRFIVGTVLDVSERRQREEEARIRAELEQLLVGVVSHDLRSPLGTLRMGVHMLAGAELDDVQRSVLGRMESSIDTATQLVVDLLDFTKARLGGGIPIEPRQHDGHWLVGEVVGDAQVAYPGRLIVHDRSGDGGLPVDGERLKQVVSNLLANAIRHSPDDSGVRVCTMGDEGRFAVEVHNIGEPIPAAQQASIFEPLQQGGHGSARGKGSLGLGLFIVRHVVEAHGGEVRVHSSESEGTTFAFWLPTDVPAPPS